MIDPDRAIVRPVKGKNCPDLPDLAVMVSTKSDLDWLASLFDDRKLEQKKLYNGIFVPFGPVFVRGSHARRALRGHDAGDAYLLGRGQSPFLSAGAVRYRRN